MPPDPTPQQLASLSALADGSLSPERVPEVEAMVAASPELQALLDREREAAEALRALREHDRAPLGLKLRIDAARPSPRARRSRGLGYGGAVAAVLAAVVLALVLVLPGGSPGAPSLAAAAALATRPITSVAPRQDADQRGKLDQSVGDLYFPNWSGRYHLTAIGQRTDELGGHRAVTVVYEDARTGTRVAYTILSTPPLTRPDAPVRRDGLQVLILAGRTVVTWRSHGHTCVLSAGPRIAAAALAAWAHSEQ